MSLDFSVGVGAVGSTGIVRESFPDSLLQPHFFGVCFYFIFELPEGKRLFGH